MIYAQKIDLPDNTYGKRNSFRNIVKDAYQYSDKTLKGPILSGSTASIISSIEKKSISIDELEALAKQSRQERIKGFQIIALRPKTKIQQGKKLKQKHLKI